MEKKTLNDIKEALKDLINDNQSKEFVDKLANIDKMLDTYENENTETRNKLSQIQNDYIDLVKNTSFTTPPKEEEVVKPEKSFEELLDEFAIK